MKMLGRPLSQLTTVTTVLGGLSVALMMVHVSLDVLFRYVFANPLPGTLTIVSYYYMVIAAFVPLAFAEKRDAHISVEVVTDLLPLSLRRHLAGLMLIPTAAIMGLLTWRTFEDAMEGMALGASQLQGTTNIPVWPSYFALPLGAGLMTLILGLRFAAYVAGADAGLHDETRSSEEVEQ